VEYAPTQNISMPETTTDKLENTTDDLKFSHWPAFAGFIRQNHMVEYAQALLNLSREADLPIMKLIAHLPEEQLLDMTIQGHGEFLENVEKNILREHLNNGLRKWEDDDLGIVSPDDIAMEDITIGTFIRKKAMLALLPLYTTDAYEIIAIIKEIDIFDAEALTVSTEMYIKLQKRKEEKILSELRHSRELYRQAQAISHIGNWSWDLKTDKIRWSEEMYRIYGLEPKEEEAGQRDEFLYLRHPEDVEHIDAHVKALLETHKPQKYVFRTIPINGEIKYLQANAQIILNDAGEAIRLHGTIQDVTEKMLIEQQIRANEAFITKIADTAPSIITTYNIKTGKYNFVSEGITKLLGYTPEQVLEQGVAFFNDLLHPDDIAQLTEKNDAAVEIANKEENNNKNISEDFKYRVKDIHGKYRWLHTYGTVFDRDKNGDVEHVLNISVDITEQVEAEQQLQQKNIELSNSNSSLQDYAYITSHDLKEPLRKITTFSSILLSTKEKELSKEASNYLTKISEAAMRMQSMISDLLAISTISGNKAFEKYSLQQIAKEAVQRLEHKIEDKKAVLHIGELPTAHIVPAQFRQLFQNLINNSLKFTRNGVDPEININASFLTPYEVKKYGVAKSGKYIQIEFTDNGIGFENDYSEKIFSIFQRLHGQGEYEGTGIGLSICKKVVENHGGVIFASGSLGEGAKFTIIIPA
jgi:PAS domain S-box-containing protein